MVLVIRPREPGAPQPHRREPGVWAGGAGGPTPTDVTQEVDG